jgi:hypothetical protein
MQKPQVYVLYGTQTIKVGRHTSILQYIFRITKIRHHSNMHPYLDCTEITFVISTLWVDWVEKSAPQNTQRLDFDDEHEHYYFEHFYKAPASASANSTSTSILHHASNSKSIYFDEIFSKDDPRYSHVPHASKVGNLSLRLRQPFSILDCCKAVLIWKGSARYPF